MSNTLHTAGSSKLFCLVTAQRNTFHNSSMSVLILSIPDSFTAGVVMNTKGQEANRICGQHCTNMESAGSLFLSYTFIAYLVDCTKLQRTTRWAGAKKDGKGGGWKLLGSGVRGGDRQDLIKDGLCYVISSKKKAPLLQGWRAAGLRLSNCLLGFFPGLILWSSRSLWHRCLLLGIAAKATW